MSAATATRTTVPIVGVAAVLALGGCTAEPAPPGPGSSPSAPADSPSPSPEPTTSPEAPDDVSLTIDTIATAADGAMLDLGLRVHRSLPADDPEAAALRELMIDECGPDFVSAERLDTEDWGLVRVDVTAQVEGGSWPEALPVSLVTAPRGDLGAAAVASSGAPLTVPTDPAGELGPCLVPRAVHGPGEAYLVLGIRSDYSSDDSRGLFWNGYRFGFSSMLFGEAADITFRECVIRKSDLGQELSAPEVGYTEASSPAECSAGAPAP